MLDGRCALHFLLQLGRVVPQKLGLPPLRVPRLFPPIAVQQMPPSMPCPC